jgi:hypothetical protein
VTAAATPSAAGPPQAGVGHAGAGLRLGACIAPVVGTTIGSGAARHVAIKLANRPRQTGA